MQQKKCRLGLDGEVRQSLSIVASQLTAANLTGGGGGSTKPDGSDLSGESGVSVGGNDGGTAIIAHMSKDVIAISGSDIRLSCHIQNINNKTVRPLNKSVLFIIHKQYTICLKLKFTN